MWKKQIFIEQKSFYLGFDDKNEIDLSGETKTLTFFEKSPSYK